MVKFIGRTVYTIIALVLVGIGIWYMVGSANGTSELYAKICALETESFFIGLFYDGLQLGSLLLAGASLCFVLILPEVWGVKPKSVLHIAFCTVRALLALGAMAYGIYATDKTSIFITILAVLLSIFIVGIVILPALMFIISYYKGRDMGEVVIRFVVGFIITALTSLLLPLGIVVGIIALGFAIFSWAVEGRPVIVEVIIWL